MGQAAGVWRKGVNAEGEMTFTSPDDQADLALSKPISLRSGLDATVSAEAARFDRLGQVVKRTAPNHATTREGVPVVAVMREIEEADGRRLRIVVGAELRRGLGLVCRLRIAVGDGTKASLQTGYRMCFEILGQVRARLAAIDGSTAASAQDDAPPRAVTAAAPARAAPGGGLKPGAIEAVYFWQSLPQYNGLTGLLDVRSSTYLILKDGTVYSGFDAAPEDFDVAASRRAKPQRWGSWRRDGRGYAVSWGPEGRKDRVDPGGLTKPCRPARPGETLNQGFEMSSATSIGIGESRSMTMSQSFFRFKPDGTFNRGSSTAFNTPGAVGHTGRGPQGGRYRLDGYVLELAYPDGRVERRSYCRVESGFILVNGAGMFTRSD